MNMFNLSDTTRLASPHLYFTTCFSQQGSSIVDKAVHICVSTVLRDVPTLYFQQLLDVSEEYLNHPSCLVELRDCGSRQLEVVSEQLYHIAMFVIPDSYASERFGVFFFVCSPVSSIISSMSTFCALVSGNKRSSICECRLSLCLTTKNTFLLSQLSRREKSQ